MGEQIGRCEWCGDIKHGSCGCPAEAEIERLRAMLFKARSGLSGGLWDYGPGQDEHEQCEALVAEIDAALRPNV